MSWTETDSWTEADLLKRDPLLRAAQRVIAEGMHFDTCDTRTEPDGACTCGIAALAEIVTSYLGG